MRDLRQRPEEIGKHMKREDCDAWRAELELFLDDALSEQKREELKNKSRSKWQRLATYDLVCGCDWQLVVNSSYGWNTLGKTNARFEIYQI